MRFWQTVVYLVIAGIITVVIYGIFTAPQPVTTPTATTTPTFGTTTSATAATSTVALTGTFVALLDGTDRYERTFKYLVLVQNGHNYRIDLRPLYGVNYTDINQRLGVRIGERVVVTGTVDKKGVFVVQQIKPAA